MKILLVLLLAAAPALACEFDSDCAPLSRCVKEGGHIHGACVGGISPGRDHEIERETERQQQIERSNEKERRRRERSGPPDTFPTFAPDEPFTPYWKTR